MNFFGMLVADFSETTQGAMLGVQFNFRRTEFLDVGIGIGIGANGCIVYGCEKVFIYFPIYVSTGIKLARYFNLYARAGGLPAWVRRGSSDGVVAKPLFGAGIFIPYSRGGFSLGFDLLPVNGLAHLVTVGYML